MSNAIAILRKDEILAKVRDGYILSEIAADLGISKQAISFQLKDDPEYQEAKKEQVESMIAECKKETWAASEPVDIARAREMTKFAFRYAESVDPARWGQRSQGGISTESMADLLLAVSSKMLREQQVVSTQHAAVEDALDITPVAQSLTNDVK